MDFIKGIISTIAGAIVGGAIGYISAMLVAKKHAFNQAAAKFRSAFIEQLYKLENIDEDVFKILDSDAYASHLRAKIEFEPYLSKSEIEKMEKTWKKYYEYVNFKGQKVAPGSLDVRRNEKEKAINIIREILKYAEPK